MITGIGTSLAAVFFVAVEPPPHTQSRNQGQVRDEAFYDDSAPPASMPTTGNGQTNDPNAYQNDEFGSNDLPSAGEELNNDQITEGAGTYSDAIAARVGESTAGVPLTQGGNLACAWVCNDVYKSMTGSYITDGTNWEGGHLSVTSTTRAMMAQPNKFTQVSANQAINSGKDYFIVNSRDFGGGGSHIGLGNGNTIWSNSSSRKGISQNYNTNSWNNGFGGQSLYFTIN